MVNLTILMVSISAFAGCKSVQGMYARNVKDELKKQPPVSEEILTDSDIEHLPLPVRNYIKYTGAVGKSKPQYVRITPFEPLLIYPEQVHKPIIQ